MPRTTVGLHLLQGTAKTDLIFPSHPSAATRTKTLRTRSPGSASGWSRLCLRLVQSPNWNASRRQSVFTRSAISPWQTQQQLAFAHSSCVPRLQAADVTLAVSVSVKESKLSDSPTSILFRNFITYYVAVLSAVRLTCCMFAAAATFAAPAWKGTGETTMPPSAPVS